MVEFGACPADATTHVRQKLKNTYNEKVPLLLFVCDQIRYPTLCFPRIRAAATFRLLRRHEQTRLLTGLPLDVQCRPSGASA